MGMAASQARFLGITARKTNTEYEGQQVNQQRTALANQSANLFNQMLALEVPSPPSKSDSKFTKTVYSFIDDTAEQATITSIVNNPNPATSATYPKIVNYTTAIQVDKSYRASLSGSSMMYKEKTAGSVEKYQMIKVGSYPEAVLSKLDLNDEYAEDTKSLKSIKATFEKDYKAAHPTATDAEIAEAVNTATKDLHKFTKDDKTYYVNAESSKIKDKDIDTGAALVFYDSDGKVVTDLSAIGVTESGTKYTLPTEPRDIDKEDNSVSPTDITNIENIKKIYGDLAAETVFYKYNINGVDYYIPSKDTNNKWQSDDFKLLDPANSFGYFVKNESEPKEKYAPAKVNYDASGRLQSIILKDGDNELTFNVSVNSITDEDAYEDAFNEYKYKMAQYEKEVEDINAKCKAIQEQDRTLELRLKQLDTEQEALTQEMDAIKKVIDKNVETTFKTFA